MNHILISDLVTVQQTKAAESHVETKIPLSSREIRFLLFALFRCFIAKLSTDIDSSRALVQMAN